METTYVQTPNSSIADMAALLNNQNNQWNNPLMYLVFLEIFKNKNGNVDVNNLQNQMQDNQNSNLLMDGIKGNTAALNTLATNLNCDLNTITNSICNIKNAISSVKGEVGFTGEKVINAANMGDCRIIEAINSCCCNTQKEILKMGYENQLSTQSLNNTLAKGFADLGYANKTSETNIIQNQNLNTQRLIDTMNNHWNQDLRDRIFEMSQKAQTAEILKAIPNTTTTA